MIGKSFFDEQRRELAPGDVALAPDAPAVFLVWAASGAPYLARTALLRRRLNRLLRQGDRPSRMLNLVGVAQRIDYWLCGSRLESAILYYSLAREHYPDHYLKLAKLRMPSYVKLTLSNAFPRTHVTNRLAGGRGVYFGPFRTRATAEQFEAQALDFFQIRRCQENLDPRPDHPGCIYGEMGMCLRPCQEVVNEDEYASEVRRLEDFLDTGGASLLESVASARERCSADMHFEEAARQHKRYEKVQQVLALRDDLVSEVGRLSGVAVTPSVGEGAVTLWFFRQGAWADPVEFSLAPDGTGVSLDHRLQEIVRALDIPRPSVSVRQEHVALLSGWFYSSWRDGEWLGFRDWAKVPYRKLVNAISRVAKRTSQTP